MTDIARLSPKTTDYARQAVLIANTAPESEAIKRALENDGERETLEGALKAALAEKVRRGFSERDLRASRALAGLRGCGGCVHEGS
jgi:Arc/MetJ family transcription regulator